MARAAERHRARKLPSIRQLDRLARLRHAVDAYGDQLVLRRQLDRHHHERCRGCHCHE